jgi:hypothetical protein
MHGSYILATKNRGLKTQLYALFIYLFIWFLSKLCAYLKQHKGSTNRPSLGKFQATLDYFAQKVGNLFIDPKKKSQP